MVVRALAALRQSRDALLTLAEVCLSASRTWSGSGSFGVVLLGQEGVVWEASFSTDGARIVPAPEDGSARVWAAETGRESLRLEDQSSGVRPASVRLTARRAHRAGLGGRDRAGVEGPYGPRGGATRTW